MRAPGLSVMAALLLAPAARAEEPVALPLRFAAGEMFRQKLVVRQTETRIMASEDGAANPSAVTEVELHTIGIVAPPAPAAPDRIPVSLHIERVRLDLAFPGKRFSYDTAGGKDVGPAADAQRMRQALDERIGKIIETRVAPDGRVFIDKGGSLPVGESLTPFGNPLGTFPGLLPEGPVKTGDRWNREYSESHATPRGSVALHYKVESTLEAFEGDGPARVAVIECTVTLSPDAPASANAPADAFPFTVDGSAHLTSRLSLREGKVVRVEGSCEMIQRPKPGRVSDVSGPKEARYRQEIESTLEPIAADATPVRPR